MSFADDKLQERAVTCDYAIELDAVSKSFAASQVTSGASAPAGLANGVHEIDLSVRNGEFFTLLGPSGCGKTTTLRIVAGFEQPSSGMLKIQGHDMAEVPAYRRPVNTVFQSYALFPHLSVFENIAFGLSLKGVEKREISRRVKDALELVRLPDVHGRRPSELSGGQQQRVALARALINQPAVLLLDEPLGALDLQLRKEMQVELKGMQKKLGITFLFVTHDQEEALTMSDRIAVMSRGKILQIGTPEEIYERPSTRFGAEFIGEMNFLDAGVISRGGTSTQVAAGGRRFDLPLHLSDDRITLAFRPEVVDVGHPAADDDQGIRFGGLLKDAIYVGTDTRYLVQLDTGETIVSRQRNSRGADRSGKLAKGHPVSLVVRPAEVLCFPQ